MQSTLVYTSIMLFMIFHGFLASKRENLFLVQRISFYSWEVLLPLLAFGVLFGMRYDVGTDHLAYLYTYETGNGIERYEPIFAWLSNLGIQYKIHYSVFFGLIAFLQVFLLFYTFKDKRFLFPYLAFVLFAGQYFIQWMNGIRQDMAACIFLYAAVTYISHKNIWKYIICCILACGFHRSAIILFIFYPLLVSGKDYFKNRYLQLLGILFVSGVALLKIDILPYFGALIDNFSIYFGYEYYTENVLLSFFEKTNTGLSILLMAIIDIIVILYSKRIKQCFSGDRSFTIIYNLYYFGTLLQTLLINNLVLARPFRYFRCFKLVVIAYLLYYLYNTMKKRKYNMVVYFLVFCILILLFAAVIKNEPFYFYWEQ